jgi:hypothetical protein
MRYAMPNPELINGVCYLRLHVPNDVAEVARGKTLQVPVGDDLRPAKVNKVVKVSLRTKVYDEAKKRFTKALAAIERQWEALRSGPASIPHKTLVAVAGQHYRRGAGIAQDEPGEPTVRAAARGLRERLGVTILSDMVCRPWSLEGRRIEQRQTVEPIPSMNMRLTWSNARPLSVPARVVRAFMSATPGAGP